jgi:type II pantothenate kinase
MTGAAIMAVFCHLHEPDLYRACDWDLLADAAGREQWLDEFLRHGESILAYAAARREPPPEARVASMWREYRNAFEHLRRHPAARGRLDVLELCILRDELLIRHAIGDPYVDVKQDENDASIALYPRVIQRLEALPASAQVEALFRGVLAGNRFDLGSPATGAEYQAGGMDFFAELDRLGPRPWAADSLDAIAERFDADPPAYRKVIVFVDNAGADAVLGILPLARWLAGRGIVVTLAATDHWALNDITLTELDQVLARVGQVDRCLRSHVKAARIRTVGTGHGQPLIDLAGISPACNHAAADCDLIILEGMGRAIESNYFTPFRRDCIRVAMIKNESVARHYGLPMFGLVCTLSPAS